MSFDEKQQDIRKKGGLTRNLQRRIDKKSDTYELKQQREDALRKVGASSLCSTKRFRITMLRCL